jgi:hypothetical protein
MATWEVIVRASPTMGELEAIGILGAYVVPAGEKSCDEVPLSVLEVMSLSEDFERDAHGIGPEEEQKDSGEEYPATKELKARLGSQRDCGYVL